MVALMSLFTGKDAEERGGREAVHVMWLVNSGARSGSLRRTGLLLEGSYTQTSHRVSTEPPARRLRYLRAGSGRGHAGSGPSAFPTQHRARHGCSTGSCFLSVLILPSGRSQVRPPSVYTQLHLLEGESRLAFFPTLPDQAAT